MINGLRHVARDRARLERDRVVLSSMIRDMNINESVLDIVADSFYESGEEDENIDELIEKIPESTPEDEEKEIDRVLSSETGLEVDEILDIQDAVD